MEVCQQKGTDKRKLKSALSFLFFGVFLSRKFSKWAKHNMIYRSPFLLGLCQTIALHSKRKQKVPSSRLVMSPITCKTMT